MNGVRPTLSLALPRSRKRTKSCARGIDQTQLKPADSDAFWRAFASIKLFAARTLPGDPEPTPDAQSGERFAGHTRLFKLQACRDEWTARH